jgi:hypothetical protein
MKRFVGLVIHEVGRFFLKGTVATVRRLSRSSRYLVNTAATEITENWPVNSSG